MKTIIAILALSFVLIGCSDSKESAGMTVGTITSIGDAYSEVSDYGVFVDVTGDGTADIFCRNTFANSGFGHFKNHGLVGREVDVEIFLDTVTCQYEYVAHLREESRVNRPKLSTEM